MAVSSACKDSNKDGMDNGKYVRYTPEQVEALERLYHDCPKPSSMRRQQLIRECPILSNIEPKQIKVWFQNRRYPTIPIYSCILHNIYLQRWEKRIFFFLIYICFCIFTDVGRSSEKRRRVFKP